MRGSLMIASRLCAMLAAALLIAGCGGSGGTDTAADTGEAPATVAEFTADADGKLEGPTEVQGGLVEISLENAGEEPASLQLLPTGDATGQETYDSLMTVIEGEPAPEGFMPGGGVGQTPPGETASVVQNLDAGTWIAVNDSGGGDESPWTEFEVTEGDAGEPPAAAATITATDFAFDATGLKAGENDVQFANDGEEWHHVVAAPLTDGATAEDLKELFASEEPPEGPPPGLDVENGVSSAVLGGGQSQNLKLNLAKPGKYALLCFISNKEGGPPHVAYGMIEEVDVQ